MSRSCSLTARKSAITTVLLQPLSLNSVQPTSMDSLLPLYLGAFSQVSHWAPSPARMRDRQML